VGRIIPPELKLGGINPSHSPSSDATELILFWQQMAGLVVVWCGVVLPDISVCMW